VTDGYRRDFSKIPSKSVEESIGMRRGFSAFPFKSPRKPRDREETEREEDENDDGGGGRGWCQRRTGIVLTRPLEGIHRDAGCFSDGHVTAPPPSSLPFRSL